MPKLSSTEIENLVSSLKKFPYLCNAGNDNLGPLNGPPQIEADIETKDVLLYETGSEPQATYLTRNSIKVTLKTRNIDKAMELLSDFAKGDNILDPSRKVILTLVPITESSSEKTITFTDAYLQPGLSFSPAQNDEPSDISLVYICKPDAETGKPFLYGESAE